MKTETEYCKCGNKADPEGNGPYTGPSSMCPKCRAKYILDSMHRQIAANQREVLLSTMDKLSRDEIIGLLKWVLGG